MWLVPYVASFGIVPVFAFANAGLPVPVVAASESLCDPVVLSVMLGVVIGKPVGIFGASWLQVRSGLARYRDAARSSARCVDHWRIGFTVAMFVAELAFEDGPVTDPCEAWSVVGSALAAVAGFAVLRFARRPASVSR